MFLFPYRAGILRLVGLARFIHSLGGSRVPNVRVADRAHRAQPVATAPCLLLRSDDGTSVGTLEMRNAGLS